MAASPVLADSSFYIRSLRERRDPLRELALAAATRDLAICGVIRCEVGRALRNVALLDRFHESRDVMINVPTDDHLWEEAEKTLWELDRRGTILSLTDVVIGCCAKRIGAVVLTHDQDFDLIPGVRTTARLEM
jgi:predicted nucleic acid-binding protein